MRYAFLFLIFLFVALIANSQVVTDADWLNKVAAGEKAMLRKSYDSALIYLHSAIKEGKTKQYQRDELFSHAYIMAGHCYQKKSDYIPAHQYFMDGYQNALRYQHKTEEGDAFTHLNQLHAQILQQNISFPYKKPEATIREQAAFAIEHIEIKGDSVSLTVRGGSIDGITDSSGVTEVWSRYSGKRDFNFLGYGKVIDVTANRTVVSMPAASAPMKDDLVFIEAEVPIHLNKTPFKKLLLYSAFVTDNAKQRILDRRYYYYYFDNWSDSSVQKILQKNVDEIVDMLAADTLTDKTYATRATTGIFTGKNMMKAMAETRFEHINYFVNFLLEYPAKYIGNDYKFSEIYATWIINNAPLTTSDVKAVLLKAGTAARRQLTINLQQPIVDKNLAYHWLNSALDNAGYQNLKDALNDASLLHHASIIPSLKKYKGWGYYIDALCATKNDNNIAADSLYRLSLSAFVDAKDKEGQSWAHSALQNLQQSNRISFAVQTGHLTPYDLAISPGNRFFATGGEDFLVKIWDATLAKEIKTIAAHTDGIISINYSPDGKYLVTCSYDSTIKVWNAFDYSLIQTIRTLKPEGVVIFTPDSKSLVSGGRDSLIKFWDPIQGTLLKTLPARHKGRITDLSFNPKLPNRLASTGIDSLVLFWDLSKGDTTAWIKRSARILSVKFSNDGKLLSFVGTHRLIEVWDYQNWKSLFTDSVATFLNYNGTSRYYTEDDFSPDSRYIVYATPNRTMRFVDPRTLKLKEYTTLRGEFLSAVYYSDDGNYLIQKYHQNSSRIVDLSGWTFASDFLDIKTLKQYTNPPAYVEFNKDASKLFITTTYNSYVDLSDGQTKFLYYGGQVGHNGFWLNNEKHYAYVRDSGLAIRIIGEDKDAAWYGLLKKEKVNAGAFAFSDSICYIGGDNGTITAWLRNQNKVLFSHHFYQPEEAGIQKIVADTVRKRIYFTVKAGKAFAADAFTGVLLDSMDMPNGMEMVLGKKALYISGENSHVYKLDPQTFKVTAKFRLHKDDIGTGGVKLSPDEKWLAVAAGTSHLVLADAETGAIKYSFKAHDFAWAQLTISPDGKLIATAGFDNKVSLWDLATGTFKGSIYTPVDQDFIITDEEGHYMAPKKSLDGIVFSYKNASFNYEQFDLQFNRPDIVLTKYGKADPALIGSYHAAYRKRLKRQGLTEEQVKIDVHLPLVRIVDRFNVRPTTSSQNFEISVECYDSKYKLQTLHIVVNNTPLFGAKGKPVDQEQAVLEKINIPLSYGANIIKVYCANEKGAVSLKESIEIYCAAKIKETKTYFIGIGVSQYKDSAMNLQYAAKDIRDLASTFVKVYDKTIVDTLLDKNVTKENIFKLKQKLAGLSVNDKVILAVTGHGLLSDSLDFYYATHDVNFSKPTERGLKYEELENLLNDIPCRQKLLLIDACHSGALDKDELLQKNILQKGNVKATNARSAVRVKKNKIKLNNTFDLMQNQFADLSAGNGTVVISAAGGLEYAFESPKWNNGVFTYSVRKAIEEDYRGRALTVQQLQSFVSEMVYTLTNGQQKPTSRKESLDYDWRIK